MPPASLRCRDLQAGDILLKYRTDYDITLAIQAGQALLGKPNPEIIHAGVLFDRTYIIEAQSSGISANDLRVQNVKYSYQVYRCMNGKLADGAGTCAKLMFDIHKRRGSLPYGAGGAIRSIFGAGGKPTSPGTMDALLDRILEGRAHPFFCSQFVAYVYQFAAEQSGIPARQLFNFSDAKLPPSTLSAALYGHPMFSGVGFLAPDVR